jgi:hypothetical protein
MQFTWGDLIVIGVIESLSIDFDHFAPNGVPLRAKVALSIKGQDREKQLEPRSDSRRDAPAPGGGGSAGLGLGASLSAGLGVSGGLGVAASLGASASIGLALGGESAADFAARMGVDASAWRSLALGGESSLSFSAGAEIAFTAGASASLGLGFAAGVTAGASASLEASLGLTAGAWSGVVATSGGSGSAGASGIALTSAGGVAAALGAVQTAKIEAAAQQARAAFQAPPKSASASPGVSTTPRASPGSSRDRGPSEVAAGATRSTALPPATGPAVGTSAAGAPQGSAPRLDARASSFGFGVPLRTTVGEAAEQRALTLRGATALRGQVGDGAVPETDDPTVPPWVALPERGLGAEVITAGLGTRRRAGSCGCGG